MKQVFKFIILFITFHCIMYSNSMAQAPQGFPYQAVARGVAGNLLASQTIALRISILDGSSSGAVVYKESHGVTTNSLGLFNVNIGQGTTLSGTFSAINWGSGSKYIKVEMDASGGSSYVVMGTSQLLSVPYALYANVPGVAGPQGPQGIAGSNGTNGTNGKTILNGSANPLAGIGTDGDFYINTTSNQLFGPKTSGVWGSGISLVGPQGIQGNTGATGATGPQGIQGVAGTNGKTMLNGTTNPGAGIGTDGDFYINKTSNQLFGPKASGAWGSGTSLVGPQGAQGIQGIQGPQGVAGLNGSNGTNGTNGTNGKTILNGTSNPLIGTGVDGDFYINTTTDQIFGPKTSGAWGSGTALVGPQGAQGIQGPQGVAGSNGSNGTNGTNGKTILNGTSNPLIGTGVDGDFYINTTTDQIFGPKTSGAWGSGTALVGPQGAQGTQGIQGPQGVAGTNGSNGTNGTNGTNGKTILNGLSNPTAGIGVDGDFYMNIASSQLFGPKASGVWGTGISLIGPQGIQGPSGTDSLIGQNGLTRVNDSLQLGGRLNQNTAISQDGLSFQFKDNDGSSTTTDISQTSFGLVVNLSSTANTQTFTAINTAKLASIKIRVTAVNGSSISLSLKNSSGVTLGTQTINYTSLFDNWQTFNLSGNIVLNASSVYTLSVVGTAGTTWYYSNTNVYAGGQAGFGGTKDFAFEILSYIEAPALYISNQKVGIGNSNPASKLDVTGKTRTSLFQLTTGAGAGNILVSDANGNGDWTPLTSLASGTLDQAYDFTTKGAGRTIVADSGAVKISGEDGFQVTGTLNSGDEIDISGAGTRMFFNPRKSAFRAGTVLGANWDKDSIGFYSVATGHDSKAKGDYTTAIGSNNASIEDYTTSVGGYNIATSFGSTCIGQANSSIGSFGFAAGHSNSASGSSSTALGNQNQSKGTYSTTLGYNNLASAMFSQCIGTANIANGNYSLAMGRNTQSNAYTGTVIGQFNDTLVAPQTSIISSTPLFIIGNGSSVFSPSNAMVVRYDGHVGIGNNAATYQFEVSTNSAAKPSSSTWTISSDARLKTIDGIYSRGLDDILKLNTIKYHYAKGNARNLPTNEQSYGFIAQEVQNVFPEAVTQNEDGYLSLDIHPILISYINGFKELNAKAEKQQAMIDLLQQEIELLKTQLKTSK